MNAVYYNIQQPYSAAHNSAACKAEALVRQPLRPTRISESPEFPSIFTLYSSL